MTPVRLEIDRIVRIAGTRKKERILTGPEYEELGDPVSQPLCMRRSRIGCQEKKNEGGDCRGSAFLHGQGLVVDADRISVQ